VTAPRLADLTTLRLGGPAARYAEADSEAALVAAVREADDAGEPLLVIGGGSNLVVAEGWVGVEALTGIPGSTGATPVQNVGAYGQEVAGVVSTVRVWDREEARVRTLAVGQLGFGYRTSILKRSMRTDDGDLARWAPTPRYVVLEVGFQLRLGTLSAPVAYPELAATLGVAVGERAPLTEVRDAVRTLRARKGMLLDADDHDTWSAGSFFTNPVLPAGAELPDGAPRFPVRTAVPETTTGPSLGAIDPGLVKTSAAWLIEHAGFGKGFGLPGPVSLSTKHTLALTNRGEGTTADLLALARAVRDGVRERFGVTLEPEPVLVGVSL
jgi:UDP-N-acetylmuramate dehydrogenase